jgi:hypothetical protein
MRMVSSDNLHDLILIQTRVAIKSIRRSRQRARVGLVLFGMNPNDLLVDGPMALGAEQRAMRGLKRLDGLLLELPRSPLHRKQFLYERRPDHTPLLPLAVRIALARLGGRPVRDERAHCAEVPRVSFGYVDGMGTRCLVRMEHKFARTDQRLTIRPSRPWTEQ